MSEAPGVSAAPDVEKRRRRLGLTPTDLWRQSGVNRATIINLETGGPHVPRGDTIDRLRNALAKVETEREMPWTPDEPEPRRLEVEIEITPQGGAVIKASVDNEDGRAELHALIAGTYRMILGEVVMARLREMLDRSPGAP